MPYSKDILERKKHLIRAAESSHSYFDLNRLIVDVRKVNDSNSIFRSRSSISK